MSLILKFVEHYELGFPFRKRYSRGHLAVKTFSTELVKKLWVTLGENSRKVIKGGSPVP